MRVMPHISRASKFNCITFVQFCFIDFCALVGMMNIFLCVEFVLWSSMWDLIRICVFLDESDIPIKVNVTDFNWLVCRFTRLIMNNDKCKIVTFSLG